MLRIRATPQRMNLFSEFSRGGEAVIRRLKPDQLAKIFLKPNAPEYADNRELQEAAKVRIQEMQTKLFELPENLPPEVVTPIGVLQDEHENIFGYVMSFVDGRTFDKLSRTSSRFPLETGHDVLIKLHALITQLHALGVIIGDLNENNLILSGETPYIIDADSMQFGKYQCKTFTPRFTAPKLLKMKQIKNEKTLYLAEPYDNMSDWYSFLVIAMRLLTLTDPYGGEAKNIGLAERIINNITVFDKRVIYPKIAKSLKEVPRPILEVFFRVFHLQERFVPDPDIFKSP